MASVPCSTVWPFLVRYRGGDACVKMVFGLSELREGHHAKAMTFHSVIVRRSRMLNSVFIRLALTLPLEVAVQSSAVLIVSVCVKRDGRVDKGAAC